jgi:hypothetical protein
LKHFWRHALQNQSDEDTGEKFPRVSPTANERRAPTRGDSGAERASAVDFQPCASRELSAAALHGHDVAERQHQRLAHYLMGSSIQSAFIFLIGGNTGNIATDVTTSTETVVW